MAWTSNIRSRFLVANDSGKIEKNCLPKGGFAKQPPSVTIVTFW